MPNRQEPATENQIQVERPNIKKSANVLPGYIAGSFNGGHHKVIGYFPVFQGQVAHALRGQIQFQTLTPKTPAYQKLRCDVIAVFVPHSAVWKNYEEFYAQQGGSSITKIAEMPNFNGCYHNFIYEDENEDNGAFVYNTTAWRDCWLSSYIPRPGVMEANNEGWGMNTFPAYSALAARGYIVTYNWILRNKEYDDEIPEYKNDFVSAEEFNTMRPYFNEKLDFYYGRAKRDNSYYTNYRTELQGFEASYPPDNMNSDSSLISWMAWEQNYASAVKQAMDAQKSPWQILAEERGAKIALQGKPQIIGRKVFNLNYSSITQNAYNNNDQIDEKARVMGFQGAFSYTNIDMPLFENVTFEEDGIVHLIATVTAESVFTSGLNRQMLNISANDIFRPELAENKHDVLYKQEMRSSYAQELDWQDQKNQAVGFKRRFSEYFYLPTCVNGDMTPGGYFKLKKPDGAVYDEDVTLHRVNTNIGEMIDSNNTYMFYENNPDYDYDEALIPGGVEKKLWRDYTDLQMNRNMAVPYMVRTIRDINYKGTNKGGSYVDGQNQIFYVGELNLITTLPVPEEIAKDYRLWGGH